MLVLNPSRNVTHFYDPADMSVVGRGSLRPSALIARCLSTARQRFKAFINIVCCVIVLFHFTTQCYEMFNKECQLVMLEKWGKLEFIASLFLFADRYTTSSGATKYTFLQSLHFHICFVIVKSFNNQTVSSKIVNNNCFDPIYQQC